MILLQKARIFDQRSKHHLKVMDILIEKGQIVKISRKIQPDKKAKVVSSKALSISPGWLDIGTYNGDPGYEYREDLDTLRAAAAEGGYCGLAPFPTGFPTLDTKGQLRFLINQTNDHAVAIYPIAALTKNREGQEISEILDLHEAGAVAFSDGVDDHLSDEQLLRNMLYLKAIDGLTIYNACDNIEGHLNEGEYSVKMGLVGKPAHLEESNINNAIRQSEYAQSRLLIHNVSTVAFSKEIKKSNNRDKLSFSVPFMNLFLEDKDVQDFDLNLKVSPPLRDKSKELSKAVENGLINIITSNHTPLSIDEKDQPFGLSKSGASTIELAFAALLTYSKGISLERIIHCLSIGPHEVLEINCPKIEVGEKARITVFDPKLETTVSSSQLKSKSHNNPWIDIPLLGKIMGIVNGTNTTL